MKRAVLFFSLILMASFALNAQACGKHGKKGDKKDCPFHNGKASKELKEANGGYQLTVTVKGTEEEIKSISDKFAGKIEKHAGGKCDCCECKKGRKPFHAPGIKTDIVRTPTGVIINITGDAAALKEFKSRWDKKQEWHKAHKDGKGCGCKGDCKGDCKGKGECGCKGKKDCDCKGDCGCKGKKDCDCKGDCGCKGKK